MVCLKKGGVVIITLGFVLFFRVSGDGVTGTQDWRQPSDISLLRMS